MTRTPPEDTAAPGAADDAAPPPAATVSHVLGEIAWLLTQSPLHKALAIGDLEWLVMPPMIHRQFYIFREGTQPVGLALWARCNAEAEAKLDRGMLSPGNHLNLADWNSGPALWLVDLVAPFADEANRHREIMIADLISGPLAGQRLKLHVTDPATGERTVRTIEPDAGDRLREALEAELGGKPPA